MTFRTEAHKMAPAPFAAGFCDCCGAEIGVAYSNRGDMIRFCDSDCRLTFNRIRQAVGMSLTRHMMVERIFKHADETRRKEALAESTRIVVDLLDKMDRDRMAANNAPGNTVRHITFAEIRQEAKAANNAEKDEATTNGATITAAQARHIHEEQAKARKRTRRI